MEAIRAEDAPCLGLVGGLAVGATIHYYRELALAHERIGKPMRLVMAHADLSRVAKHVWAGEHQALAEYFAELIGRLRAAGARVAAIPAITPHCCLPELLPISPLPLIDALASTNEEVTKRGYRRITLFGTRFVMQSNLFGRLTSAEAIPPQADEQDYIHETYFQLAQTGTGSEEQRRRLTKIALTIIDRDKLDAILLAGTDFAVLFDESHTPFPHLDCARAHMDHIMLRLHEDVGE